MLLKVDLQVVVHAPLQVNRQRRNAKDGTTDGNERCLDLAARFVDDAPRYAEVAVEPSVPQPTAVILNGDHQASRLHVLRDRLELGAGAIRVRPDDPETVARLELSPHREGHDSAFVPSVKVLVTRGESLPTLTLLELLEPRLPKESGCHLYGVERCPAFVQVLDETLRLPRLPLRHLDGFLDRNRVRSDPKKALFQVCFPPLGASERDLIGGSK